jgi:basic membrane protein A
VRDEVAPGAPCAQEQDCAAGSREAAEGVFDSQRCAWLSLREASMTARPILAIKAVLVPAIAFALAGLVALPVRAEGPIKIGVLIPGSIKDHGWMESLYRGIEAAKHKYGSKVKITYIENVAFADMDQVLTTLAQTNPYVIGGAGQTQGYVLNVAKRFPNIKFTIVGPNGKATENVAQYDVRQAEIGFVAGAVAAMLSKTQVVNYIGGLQIPAIVNTGTEFCNGAKYINPKATCIVSYTGNFDDVQKAKEAEEAAIAKGADISYNILNLGVRGQEQAARAHKIHMIGSYINWCPAKDPLYVAYTISGIGFMFDYAVDQIVAGTWKPESKVFGLQMGPESSGIAICQGETPQIRQRVDAIEKDILGGKIPILPD